MNKTILISIGLICSVIAAAGIMWYNITPMEHLIVSTQIMQADTEKDAFLLLAQTTFNTQAELPSHNNTLKPFIIPGRIFMGLPTKYDNEPRIIEKPALDYINKIILPIDKLKSYAANANILLSSDGKFAEYTLRLYYELPNYEYGCIEYTLILKKTGNVWAIINALGRFPVEMREWPLEK